jgi:hypothetical protein
MSCYPWRSHRAQLGSNCLDLGRDRLVCPSRDTLPVGEPRTARGGVRSSPNLFSVTTKEVLRVTGKPRGREPARPARSGGVR